MRHTLIIAALLAIGLTACGKQEEAKTEAAPAPVAAAPEAAPAAVDGPAKYTASCASCHGANGQGVAAFPKLVGLTADVVKSRLADYKAGKQVGPQSAVMMPIASMLSDAEVDGLAAHIATLK
jgi:cytochrome c553